MKKNYFILCFILFITNAKAQIIKEFTVNFESASYVLQPNDTITLNAVISDLNENLNNYSIEIIGHTDNVGNLNFNENLSKNRAKTIAEYFESKGFSIAKIHTFGKAYWQPLVKNNSDEGKAKNRRVQVIISKNNFEVKSIGSLKLKETNYKIDTKKEQIINYKSGTKITIPENAFVDKNGNPVNGIVDMSYIEYRNPLDFILSNISMDFDENSHFNSAGMFKIMASQKGEEVFLATNKKIDFDFKMTQSIPNLNFYQYNNSTKKWTALSKITLPNGAICGGSEDVDSTKNDSINICFIDDCKAYYYIKTKGIQYANSNQSLYKQYLYNKAKDTLKDFNINQINNAKSAKWVRNRDSIFELKNKIKFSRVNLKIEILSKRINLFKTKIEDIDQKYLSLSEENKSLLSNKDSVRYKNKLNRLQNSKSTLISKNIVLQDKIDELSKSKGEREVIPTFDIAQNSNEFSNYYNCFWELNKKYMTVAEQSMNLENWLLYFDANKPLIIKRYSEIVLSDECIAIQKENERLQKIAQEEAIKQQKNALENYEKQRQLQLKINEANNNANELTKSLSISNLGIYNCDQIQRLVEPIIVDVKYKDEKGNDISPLFIYLLDSNFNGIIKYDGYNNFNAYHFGFSPISKNTLFAFDANGNTYILSSDKFKEVQPLKKNILIVKKVNEMNTIEEIKDLM